MERVLGGKIQNTISISGGDISNTNGLVTANGLYFIKSSKEVQASMMYGAEAKGLQQMANTNTIKVPKVICTGTNEGLSYLILEYIEAKRPDSEDFERLGIQIAGLHKVATFKSFGNKNDNYIGSLAQSNTEHCNWSEFYVAERLIPQLKLAIDKGLLGTGELPLEEKMAAVCNSLFGEVGPSLLHGDFWRGNYLISKAGTPYLIDPAVYCGHSEVDLAMSKLFGGFDSIFYQAYHEIIPAHENQAELTEIYQLYYLLVHLNLFGSSYYSSVLNILKKYF